MSNPDNVTTLSGRITAAPVFLKTKAGEEFQARFTLAIKRAFKNKEGVYETDFIPMRLNGIKRMKLAHKLEKGASIKVMGEMRSSSFTNKDGNRIFSIFLDIESLRWNPTNFKKQENEENKAKQEEATPKETSSTSNSTKYNQDNHPYMVDSEFDLPFN